jgi:twinkle protein
LACVERIKHDVEHCTSDKGLQVFYDDGKNTFTGYCFSCAAKGFEAYVADPYNGKQPKPPKTKSKEEIFEEIQEVRALKTPEFEWRSIPAEYYRRAGVRVAYSEEDGQTPFSLNFPYSLNGELMGFKTIMLHKKAMWSIGSIKGSDLFNWEVAKKKGVRRLYITEGEFDALALEFMLETHAKAKKSQYDKFAVVSLPHGVGSAVTTIGRMRKDIEAVFDQVVCVFDNDEPGKKALKDVQKIMPDILTATYPTSAKDSNDALVRGEGMIFADFCIWKSAKPVSEGVVNVSTVLTRTTEPPTMGLSYPWEELTTMVFGQRFGEATCLGAGVGVGKTLIAHETQAWNITEHKEKVFMCLLEEDNDQTLYNVAGKIDSIPYHRPDIAKDNWDQFQETARSLEGSLFLWESEGNTDSRFDIEEILKAVRYNTMEYGVRFHVIDNITRLVDHLTATEANEFINKWSSEIANLASELKIHIDMFSHLNPPKGKDVKDHESGGEVLASQFTGSRGIMRSFPILMGFERNKMADGQRKSNSFISCIKNRKYGGEGKIKTQYQSSGRLISYDWDGDSL